MLKLYFCTIESAFRNPYTTTYKTYKHCKQQETWVICTEQTQGG